MELKNNDIIDIYGGLEAKINDTVLETRSDGAFNETFTGMHKKNMIWDRLGNDIYKIYKKEKPDDKHDYYIVKKFSFVGYAPKYVKKLYLLMKETKLLNIYDVYYHNNYLLVVM
eukprot:357447_1